jgi:WD40 repeat protein
MGEYAFSPRGDLVAVGTDLPRAEKVRVWNLRTGALAGPIFTAPGAVRPTTVQFTPDGSRFTVGTMAGESMVVDVATARPIVTFATPAFVAFLAMALSPDGTRVVTSNTRNETRVWNASTGEPIGPPRDTTDTRDWGTARYSPNGQWFATWGRHATNLWDGTTGAPVAATIPAGGYGGGVRFSSDSRSLATADETKSQVWDVPNGQPITEPMAYGTLPLGFPAFSPDGRFLRVEHQNRFYIWSVPPRLPEGTPVPEWLLRLATAWAGKKVNDAGELIDVPDAKTQIDQVRREIAALPDNASLAEWGRWVVDDRAERSIAPGFTITRAERDDLGEAMADERAIKR